MKTALVLVKRDGGLFPVDDEGKAEIDRLAPGKECLAEIRTPRNVRQHRLFFKLLQVLVENSDDFDDIDDALIRVKIATHEVDVKIEKDTGTAYFVPRSIAFASMDGTRFGRLFDRALYVITERWLVGMDRDELRQQIYDMVDGPERAALGKRIR